MARKLKDGRFILSAGEIGFYSVCPEAWRLRVVEGVTARGSEEEPLGRELHREWAHVLEEANDLRRYARCVVLLIMLAIGIYLLLHV
jgi:hypothetical protein